MLNKILRIGIIGAGSIVENTHLPVLKSNGNISVAWIYDSNIERSKLVSTMYRIPVMQESMLEKGFDEIDICLLAIPYGARLKYIELCASKQLGLYVEKPFAKTIHEHQKYCSLFTPSNIAIGFQRRYYQIVSTLSSIINSGIVGELKAIKFRQGYFTIKGGGSYLSNAQLAGGGVIIESAIHALDQILLFTNAKSVKLLQIKSLHKKGIDYDTVFSSEIKTSRGVIHIDCEISTLQNLENILELHFENTVIKCRLSPEVYLRAVGKTKKEINFNIEPEITQNTKTALTVNESFHIFWDEFISALNTSSPNITSASTSLITTSWIEQIYQNIK